MHELFRDCALFLPKKYISGYGKTLRVVFSLGITDVYHRIGTEKLIGKRLAVVAACGREIGRASCRERV